MEVFEPYSWVAKLFVSNLQSGLPSVGGFLAPACVHLVLRVGIWAACQSVFSVVHLSPGPTNVSFPPIFLRQAHTQHYDRVASLVYGSTGKGRMG